MYNERHRKGLMIFELINWFLLNGFVFVFHPTSSHNQAQPLYMSVEFIERIKFANIPKLK